jgi:hypothetical protein
MKGKYTEDQAKAVYQHAYESIRGEFSSFRDTYKQTELKIKEKNQLNQKELAREVLERISKMDLYSSDNDKKKPELKIDTNPDHGVIKPKPSQIELDLTKKKKLRDLICQTLYKQRKEKVMQEILNKTKKYDP